MSRSLKYIYTFKTSTKKYGLALFLLGVYSCSLVGIFSSVFLEFHRSSFQLFASKYHQPNSEKLVFSKVDFKSIEWKERNREFEWNNKLYDVSEIRTTKTTVEVTCVNDTEEESLIALFSEWRKSNYPTGKIKIQCQPQFCVAIFSIEGLKGYRQQFNFFSLATLSSVEQIFYPPPERSRLIL